MIPAANPSDTLRPGSTEFVSYVRVQAQDFILHGVPDYASANIYGDKTLSEFGTW